MDSQSKKNVMDYTSDDNVNIMDSTENDSVKIETTKKKENVSLHIDSLDFSKYDEIFSF